MGTWLGKEGEIVVKVVIIIKREELIQDGSFGEIDRERESLELVFKYEWKYENRRGKETESVEMGEGQ